MKNYYIDEARLLYCSLFPLKEINREYLRPWKLMTWLLGMGWLFWGALYLHYPDWDMGVSIIMGTLTYLFAPWSIATVYKAIKYKPKHYIFHILLSLFVAWLTIDGSYTVWHTYAGNQMIRLYQAPASTFLYLLTGFFWWYRGSLKDFLIDLKKEVKI